MNLKRILSLLLAAALLLPTGVRAAEDDGETPAGAALLAEMTTEEKVSQLIMPEFRYTIDEAGERQDTTVLPDYVGGFLEDYGLAGLVLYAPNTRTNAATAKLLADAQRSNAGKDPDRPQLLFSIDQEGGSVSRLGQGTMLPGSMALGAAGNTRLTEQAAGIIGEELSALGISMDFAPVLDVNTNPANPVIGLRSFSDDPETVAYHGIAFMQGLQREGIIATLKHFPGHGDTDTDSHTGLPRLDKTYEELENSDLMPFRHAITAGAEAVMTAHIQFPQIETQTYVSKKTGEEIYLPATLSKTIITGILRGDLGFQGVVVTDAMNMQAVSDHFDPYDAARLAWEAGVDILLMPVSLNTPAGVEEMKTYIHTLADMVDSGEITEDKVDAAVLRVLDLKESHGLLAPYQGTDDEAIQQVGSEYHHEQEWDIAKKAVTLLKNDNNVLPLATEGQKTVVLTPYANEVLSMEYGIGVLTDEGGLDEDADITVACVRGMTAEEALALTEGAQHVVLVTENEASYVPTVQALIRGVHQAGGDVTVLCCSLPYEAARFQEADAIALAWLAKGMTEDPREAEGPVAQYGPNMPAAMYLLLSGNESITGKLPVDIPALTDSGQFSDQVLYPRGYGLYYAFEPREVEKEQVTWDEAAGTLSCPGVPGQEYLLVEEDQQPDYAYVAEPDEEGRVVFPNAQWGKVYFILTWIKDGDGRSAITRSVATPLKSCAVAAGEKGCLAGTTLRAVAEPEGDYLYYWYAHDPEDPDAWTNYLPIAIGASLRLSEEYAGKTISLEVYTDSYVKLGEGRADGPVYVPAEFAQCDSHSIAVRAVEGQEYAIARRGEDPLWGSAPEASEGLVLFTGLDSGAVYEVFTRLRGTEGKAAVTPLATLLESLEIDGEDLVPGSVVTVQPEPADADLTYQWFRSEHEAESAQPTELYGEQGSSYTITEYDQGQDLMAFAYAGEFNVGSVGIGPVERREGAPVILTTDYETVIAQGVAGNEYAVARPGEDPDWEKASEPEPDGENQVVIGGLDSAAEYLLHTRRKADGSGAASAPFVTGLSSMEIRGEDYVEGSTLTAYPQEGLHFLWYYDSEWVDEDEGHHHFLEAIPGADGGSYTLRGQDAGRLLGLRAFLGSQLVWEHEGIGPILARCEEKPQLPYSTMGWRDSIYVNSAPGQEYTVVEKGGEPDWSQAKSTDDYSLGFTGLTPATLYEVYTRVAATDSTAASEPVSMVVATELEEAGYRDGGCLPGCTLEIVAELGDDAGITYQWYRESRIYLTGEHTGAYLRVSDPIPGATEKAYTITEADVGTEIYAAIFRDGVELCSLSGTSTISDTAFVEFDSDGGTEVLPQEGLQYGDKLTKPADPTRGRDLFLGWYCDEKLWDFEKDTVDREYMVLVAKWRSQSSGGSSGSSGGSSSGSSKSGGSAKPAETPSATEQPGKEQPAAETRFSDVPPEAQYAPAVSYCVEKGYFNGVGEGRFAPAETMTRAMFAAVLYRMAGEPAVAAENPFTDVASGAWYGAYAAWAAEQGFINGFEDGSFRGGEDVTREQMAAILYRFAGEKGMDRSAAGDPASYSDGGELSPWAAPAMKWALGAGLLRGKSDTTLAPKEQAKRSEVAQIVMNFDTLAGK